MGIFTGAFTRGNLCNNAQNYLTESTEHTEVPLNYGATTVSL